MLFFYIRLLIVFIARFEPIKVFLSPFQFYLVR